MLQSRRGVWVIFLSTHLVLFLFECIQGVIFNCPVFPISEDHCPGSVSILEENWVKLSSESESSYIWVRLSCMILTFLLLWLIVVVLEVRFCRIMHVFQEECSVSVSYTEQLPSYSDMSLTVILLPSVSTVSFCQIAEWHDKLISLILATWQALGNEGRRRSLLSEEDDCR